MSVDVKARERELECVAFVMSDKRGREFLWRIMGAYGLYRSCLRNSMKGIRDEERVIVRAALQEVAQAIHTEILEADPTGQTYGILLSEARTRKVLADDAKKKKQQQEKQKEIDDGGGNGGDSDGDAEDGSNA